MEDTPGIQAIISGQTEVDPSRALERIAIFNEDGTPVELGADGAKGDPGTDAVLHSVTVAGLIDDVAKTSVDAAPETGKVVPLIFTNGNTADGVTVAFDGGDPMDVLLAGTAVTGAELAVAAGGVVLAYSDGTSLHLFGSQAFEPPQV